MKKIILLFLICISFSSKAQIKGSTHLSVSVGANFLEGYYAKIALGFVLDQSYRLELPVMFEQTDRKYYQVREYTINPSFYYGINLNRLHLSAGGYLKTGYQDIRENDPLLNINSGSGFLWGVGITPKVEYIFGKFALYADYSYCYKINGLQKNNNYAGIGALLYF